MKNKFACDMCKMFIINTLYCSVSCVTIPIITDKHILKQRKITMICSPLEAIIKAALFRVMILPIFLHQVYNWRKIASVAQYKTI